MRSAGIEPLVRVSHVDEDALLNRRRAHAGFLEPSETVLELAQAKCEAVASALPQVPLTELEDGALVVGCDSMLEFNGEIMGKPHTPDEATARWQSMRGKRGTLHTGHWVVRLDSAGTAVDAVGAVSSTDVWFAHLSDEEIHAYVASEEPLHVAGAFTIDGLGGPFIDRIEGDHHGVIGLSLPLMRTLTLSLGVPWHSLWNR